MTTLTKLTKSTYTPAIVAVPGSPGYPGRAAVPGHYVSVTQVITPATPGGVFRAWDGKTYDPISGGPVYTYVTFAPTPAVTATVQQWVPADPGSPPIAPVAAVAGSPGSFTTDQNLGWNAGAISVGSISGSGTYTLSVGPQSEGVVAGLSNSGAGNGYAEINYGLYFTHGAALVYEAGVQKTTAFVAGATDSFTITRVASSVAYYRNGVLLYTSAVPSTGVLVADTSMYAGGDTITASVLGAALRFGISNAAGKGTLRLNPAVMKGAARGVGKIAADIRVGGRIRFTGTARGIGNAKLKLSRNPRLFGSASGVGAARELRNGVATSYGVLQALTGASSDYNYTSSYGKLSPLTSSAIEHLLVPTYDRSSGALQPMLGTSSVLSGSVGTVNDASLLPMTGLAANRSYAAVDGSLSPMQGISVQFPVLAFYAFINAPVGTLSATAHNSTGENAAYITAPMGQVQAYMGDFANLAAPKPVVSFSATGTNWLSADIAAPMPTLQASGTVSGTSQANITAPMATMIGYGGMVMSVALTGFPSLQASITSGAVMSGAVRCPLAQLSFSITAESHFSANLLAPAGQMGSSLQAWIMAPMATLTAIGTADVVASYEAYSINLAHTPKPGDNTAPTDEVTRYTNFPFQRIVRYKNSYYGMAADGLYLLEGTTDNGMPIPFTIRTCVDDFKSALRKIAAAAVFSGQIGPDATVTLYTGEASQNAYGYYTPRGQTAANHREKFGRGVKDRYFAVGISGSEVIGLDTLDLDITETSRRI